MNVVIPDPQEGRPDQARALRVESRYEDVPRKVALVLGPVRALSDRKIGSIGDSGNRRDTIGIDSQPGDISRW